MRRERQKEGETGKRRVQTIKKEKNSKAQEGNHSKRRLRERIWIKRGCWKEEEARPKHSIVQEFYLGQITES